MKNGLSARGETNCQKVKLARDPRDITRAYLRLDGGRRMEVCELVEADHAFVGKDWYEQAEEFEVRKQRSDKAKYRIIDNTAELNAYADDVIKSAKQRTKDHQREMSNRARVGRHQKESQAGKRPGAKRRRVGSRRRSGGEHARLDLGNPYNK